MSQDSSGGAEQPADGADQPEQETGTPEQETGTPEQAATQPVSAEPLPEQPVAPPPPPPQATPKRRRTGLKIALGVGVGIAVLCVAGVFLAVNIFREDIPEAGDCLTDAPDANDMTVVGCDTDPAAWTVIGIDSTMTQQQFRGLTADDGVCEQHAGTEQALWVTDAWFVRDDTDGTVVCLQRMAGEAAEPDGADADSEG